MLLDEDALGRDGTDKCWCVFLFALTVSRILRQYRGHVIGAHAEHDDNMEHQAEVSASRMAVALGFGISLTASTYARSLISISFLCHLLSCPLLSC